MNVIANIKADQEFDASGLSCPLPVLKTRTKIKNMKEGEILRVVSTDAGSLKDIDAFCRQTGNELISSEETGDSYVFFIRKH